MAVDLSRIAVPRQKPLGHGCQLPLVGCLGCSNCFTRKFTAKTPLFGVTLAEYRARMQTPFSKLLGSFVVGMRYSSGLFTVLRVLYLGGRIGV